MRTGEHGCMHAHVRACVCVCVCVCVCLMGTMQIPLLSLCTILPLMGQPSSQCHRQPDTKWQYSQPHFYNFQISHSHIFTIFKSLSLFNLLDFKLWRKLLIHLFFTFHSIPIAKAHDFSSTEIPFKSKLLQVQDKSKLSDGHMHFVLRWFHCLLLHPNQFKQYTLFIQIRIRC